MTKMKCIIFLILISLSSGFYSQEAGNAYLNIGADYSFFHVNKDVDLFKESYEKLFQSTIKENFQTRNIPFKVQASFIYLLIDRVGFCLDASYEKYQQGITLNNDQRRVLDFTTRIPFEGGFVIGNVNKLYTKMKFGFGTSSFVSTYYYKDNTMDMNYYSPINGVYSANGISYHLELGFNIVRNLQMVLSYGGITMGSEYSDKSMMKGIDRNANSESAFLPTDYGKFLSDIAVNYPYNEVAKLKYSSFSIGLQYQIPLFNKKLSIL